MSRVFDISSASDGVRLDGNGQGQVVFTVTNSSGRPLRGRFKVKPLDAVGADAITIDGAAERNFNPNDTQQVAVKVKVPPGTKAGKYRFRLDGVSIDNPDEDFTEGPALAFDVAEAAPARRSMPWWIYAVAALLLVAIGAGAYLYLGKPDQVDLPNVATRSYTEASTQLEALGLKTRKVDDDKTAGAGGRVTGQDPAAGQKVDKGSEVKLMVTTGMVELPDVTRQSYKDARDQLLALGLMARPMFEITTSAPEGRVIGQDPPARQTLRAGAEVRLTVAAGAVALPAVKGKTYKDANDQLTALGLVATPIQKVSESDPPDHVIDQDPPPDQTVEKGSQVKLTVAVAPPPPAPPPNPFVGTWVNQNNNTPVMTRLQVEEAGGAIRIHAFEKAAPAEIDWGVQRGEQIGGQLTATFDRGIAWNKVSLARQGDLLTVTSDSIFNDGRPRRHLNETFVAGAGRFGRWGAVRAAIPAYQLRVNPALKVPPPGG